MRELVELTVVIKELIDEMREARRTGVSLMDATHRLEHELKKGAAAKWYSPAEVGRIIGANAEYVRRAMQRFGLPLVQNGERGSGRLDHETFLQLQGQLKTEARLKEAMEREERVKAERQRRLLLRIARETSKGRRKQDKQSRLHVNGASGATAERQT